MRYEYCYPHFTDEETEVYKFSDLPKMIVAKEYQSPVLELGQSGC